MARRTPTTSTMARPTKLSRQHHYNPSTRPSRTHPTAPTTSTHNRVDHAEDHRQAQHPSRRFASPSTSPTPSPRLYDETRPQPTPTPKRPRCSRSKQAAHGLRHQHGRHSKPESTVASALCDTHGFDSVFWNHRCIAESTVASNCDTHGLQSALRTSQREQHRRQHLQRLLGPSHSRQRCLQPRQVPIRTLQFWLFYHQIQQLKFDIKFCTKILIETQNVKFSHQAIPFSKHTQNLHDQSTVFKGHASL